MVTLGLIRHAPTLWNTEKRLQGRADIPLSAAGQALLQDWCLPILCRDWPVYSSPLIRAQATAAHFAPQGFQIDDRLIEIDWGAWEGQRLTDLRRANPDIQVQEARGLDLQPPNGERPRDVQQRILPFCLARAKAAESTILITHKGVIRALIALADGWDMRTDHVPKIKNDCLHLIDLDDNGRFSGVQLNIPLCNPATIHHKHA